MRLFFKNYQNNLSISAKYALETSIWQALDIFDNLPENDDSFLGLINSENEVLKFSKYDKFLWIVEIPIPDKQGALQGYFTRPRCREIIKNVFNKIEFKDISGLKFEKYL